MNSVMRMKINLVPEYKTSLQAAIEYTRVSILQPNTPKQQIIALRKERQEKFSEACYKLTKATNAKYFSRTSFTVVRYDKIRNYLLERARAELEKERSQPKIASVVLNQGMYI